MLQKGKAEGRPEGKAEGLRIAIRSACTAFGIAWSDDRARTVAILDETGLAGLLDALLRSRSWPAH